MKNKRMKFICVFLICIVTNCYAQKSTHATSSSILDRIFSKNGNPNDKKSDLVTYEEPKLLNIKLGMTIEEVGQSLAERGIVIDTKLRPKDLGIETKDLSFIKTPVKYCGMDLIDIYLEFANKKLFYISLKFRNPDYKLNKEFIDTIKSKYGFSGTSTKETGYNDYDFGGRGVFGHHHEALLYKRYDGITFIEEFDGGVDLFSRSNTSFEIVALRDERVDRNLRSQFDSQLKKRIENEL